MGVLDDEPNHLAEGFFSNLIAVPAGVERNWFECFGQYANGVIAVFGGQQIESGLTVVAPVRHSDGVLVLQMIKCRPKERFFRDKSSRGFQITYSAFVADHDKPNNHGSRVAVRSRGKRVNRDFLMVIKHPKVFPLEIPDG